MQTNPFPELFDAQTAAKKLGISYGTLRAWVSKGRIPYTKIGNRLRFTDDQLLAVLEEHPAEGGRRHE